MNGTENDLFVTLGPSVVYLILIIKLGQPLLLIHPLIHPSTLSTSPSLPRHCRKKKINSKYRCYLYSFLSAYETKLIDEELNRYSLRDLAV